MIDYKTLTLSFAILLFATGCDAFEEKQAVPLVPDTLVQRPDEFAYSERVTSVLDRQDEITRPVLRAKYPEVRSLLEDALSPADADKAMAWYEGYFAGSGWKPMVFPKGTAPQNLRAWENGDKLFAVGIIKFDPKDFPSGFDSVFLQYHVQNLENRP